MLSSIFGWLLFVVIIGIIIDILAKTFDIIVAIFLVVFVGGIVGSYFKLFQVKVDCGMLIISLLVMASLIVGYCYGIKAWTSLMFFCIFMAILLSLI